MSVHRYGTVLNSVLQSVPMVAESLYCDFFVQVSHLFNTPEVSKVEQLQLNADVDANLRCKRQGLSAHQQIATWLECVQHIMQCLVC